MSFKFVKKRKRYEKSNLCVDLENMLGHSYEWYRILDRIDGKVIVNSYNYSRTTMKHYYDVCRLLRNKGIDFASIEAPNGLGNLEASMRHYRSQIQSIKNDMANPRKRPKTKASLAEVLEANYKYLAFVESLIFNKAFESQIEEVLDADK